MQRNLFKLLFVVFSLSLTGAKCGQNGPNVTICINDPVVLHWSDEQLDGLSHEDLLRVAKQFAHSGAECSKENDEAVRLAYDDLDNFVMLPPDDAKKLLDYCGMKGEEVGKFLNKYERVLNKEFTEYTLNQSLPAK